MIIYLTKKTIDRFGVQMPEEMEPPQKELGAAVLGREQGDGLFEWGGKIFYVRRKKCIQFVNFATRFTVYAVDVKKDEIYDMSNYIAWCVFDVYKDDDLMTAALKRMFTDNPISCFSRLTDKSVISALNYNQRAFMWDGERLGRYIEDGVLYLTDANYDANYRWITSMRINGKRDYHYSGERFRDLVMRRYGGSYDPVEE